MAPVESQQLPDERNVVENSTETKIPLSDQPESKIPIAGKDLQSDFETLESEDVLDFPVESNEETMQTIVYQTQQSENSDGRRLSTAASSSSMEATRVYHFWPGKNVFFFGGRFVCGPDPRGLVITTVSIILSSWVFCFYVGRDSSKQAALVITFSVILTLIVLGNLVMVSGRDPGIIPRNDGATPVLDGLRGATSSRRVSLNGVEMKIKYCRICMIFRPARSCHCAICDNCVDRFDHHCPWIGQCIGQRNYRFYLLFISWTLVFYAYIFAFSCRAMARRMSKTSTGILGTVSRTPETVALVLFSLLIIFFLGSLIIYHAYLIAINQTGYEKYRRRFVGKRNPYDKGITSNIKEALIEKLPPPRVDFRVVVDPWWFSDKIGRRGSPMSEEEEEEHEEVASVQKENIDTSNKELLLLERRIHDATDHFEEVPLEKGDMIKEMHANPLG